MFQKSIPTSVRQIKLRIQAAAAKSGRQPSGTELASGRSTTPISFRPYQQEAFDNRTNGIECWLWGRQTGKSFTLASWAVDRLITRPGRTVTILSNSRANGKELNYKCAEVCELRRQAFEQLDLSPDIKFESMNYETRITCNGKVGRILVLPANPRTARGFSGDLILDEFAFHENSAAIWEAVEPILQANSDYLCRIASTPNGRHNMFYRLVTDPRFFVRKVPRSLAWQQGLGIFHPHTRKPITPDQARELAIDKSVYDQNYECSFAAENMALLTYDLISQAETDNIGFICEQRWSDECLNFLKGSSRGYQTLISSASPSSPHNGEKIEMRGSGSDFGFSLNHSPFPYRQGPLYIGVDVGRTRDLTVITVIEKQMNQYLVRGILRMSKAPLPDQSEELMRVCEIPGMDVCSIDMTGLGVGVYDHVRKKWGYKIHGIHFASNLPLRSSWMCDGRHSVNVKAPELLAIEILRAFTDRAVRHPIDQQLRDDLRKPERVTTATGHVSIAAERDKSGHADHFWSLALAIHSAAQTAPFPQIEVIETPGRLRLDRHYIPI